MISAIVEILKNLPQIIVLIQELQKKQKKASQEKKISDDLEKINKAFKEKDEQALRDIFNS